MINHEINAKSKKEIGYPISLSLVRIRGFTQIASQSAVLRIPFMVCLDTSLRDHPLDVLALRSGLFRFESLFLQKIKQDG